MDLHQDVTLQLLKKIITISSLSFFVFCCEIDGNERGYEPVSSRPRSRPPAYQPQRYYNPYNNIDPASRAYQNPYQYQQTPSPYGGQNPYYDYDQYYVPPSQYYNNETPVERMDRSSITTNKS